VLFFAVSAATASDASIDKCPSGKNRYEIKKSTSHKHSKYAPKHNTDDLFQEFRAYISSFDGPDDDNSDGKRDLLAVPHWVAYQLNGLPENSVKEADSNPELKSLYKYLRKSYKDNDSYFVEPDIPNDSPNWYSEPKFEFLLNSSSGGHKNSSKGIDDSYTHSDWQRGHLAMFDHAQRILPKEEGHRAGCNTFYFWNAVPQNGAMNRNAWKALEDYTAAAANKYGKVWIVAGPVFENSTFRTIGDDGEIPVALPDGLFKVVVREDENGKVHALAFYFEQDYEVKVENNKSRPIPVEKNWKSCGKKILCQVCEESFSRLTSIKYLEEKTGLEFPSSLDVIRDQIPNTYWNIQKQYWSLRKTKKGYRSNFYSDCFTQFSE